MYYIKYNGEELLATSSKETQILETAGKVCSSDISVKLIESATLPENKILIMGTYNENGGLIEASVVNGDYIRRGMF